MIADITIPYSEEIYSLWLREIYEELYLFYAKGTGKEDNFGNEEDAMFFYVTKNSAGFETIAEGLEESCTIDLKSPTFAFKQNFLALLRQLILSKEYEPAK